MKIPIRSRPMWAISGSRIGNHFAPPNAKNPSPILRTYPMSPVAVIIGTTTMLRFLVQGPRHPSNRLLLMLRVQENMYFKVAVTLVRRPLRTVSQWHLSTPR